MNKSIATPSRTKAVLTQHGFSFKKSLGQNFVIDTNVLDRIVDAAGVDRTSGVVEIGPGIGALTERLALRAGSVLAFELDQRLLPILEETLQPYSNVETVHADVLNVDLRAWLESRFSAWNSVSVVANLPYYVTTPILISLLEQRLPIDTIVVMIQKEVAERIGARAGTKDYGSLSILVQYYSQPEVIGRVPRTVFMPRPHVDSAILRLRIRSRPPVNLKEPSLFFDVVRKSFSQRRKTIYKNILFHFFQKDQKDECRKVLEEAGIDPALRAEAVTMEQFAMLSDRMSRRYTDQNHSSS